MQLFSLTPLEVLLGLMTITGIGAFIMACWRNIKNDNQKK